MCINKTLNEQNHDSFNYTMLSIVFSLEQGGKDKITCNQFKNNFELYDGFIVEALPSLSYLIKTYITRVPK